MPVLQESDASPFRISYPVPALSPYITMASQLLPTGLESIRWASTRSQFQGLAAAWRSKTRFMSNPESIIADESYREIIAMGRRVLPLIFDSLRTSDEDWSAALEEITGAQPVPDEAFGNSELLRLHWLIWATENGF